MDDNDLRSHLQGLFSDLGDSIGGPADQVDLSEVGHERKPSGAARGMQAEASVFAALAENAADGIVIYSPEGRLTYVNRACCDLFGYNHAQREMVGLEFAALWPEEAGEGLAQVLAQAATGGWRGDALLRRKDGSHFSAPMTMFPVTEGYEQLPALAAIIHDVADRKQADEALMRERNLLRTLIDHLPDYVFVKDTEGRIVAHNIAYSRLGVAASPGERVGKTDFDLYPQETAERYRAQELQVMQSGQPLIDIEEHGVDATGASRWYLTTKLPLRDAQGNIAGMVGIVRDITERKLAEIERGRLMDEIRANVEREQSLNEVTARIRANIALDQVLDATVREVGKALGASRVAVWLEPMRGEPGESQF